VSDAVVVDVLTPVGDRTVGRCPTELLTRISDGIAGVD
jgi:hypothetical protein